jgi:predicted ferric reductase
VVLVHFDYWTQPVGWLLALSMLGGSMAAIIVLTGRVEAGRRTQGFIESLNYFPALRVLESSIRLNEGWAGHRAGQFAFVRSSKSERAHPYTIASAWNGNDPRITFITKALGDHTSTLHERLKVGMAVTVEGPYGCFDFDDEKPRQIWFCGPPGFGQALRRDFIARGLAASAFHQELFEMR